MPLDQSAGYRLRAEGANASVLAGPLRLVRAQDAVNFGPLPDKPGMLFPLSMPKLPVVSLDQLHIASAFDFVFPDPEIDLAPVRRGRAPRPDVVPQRRAQRPEQLGYRHGRIGKQAAANGALVACPIRCRNVLPGRFDPTPRPIACSDSLHRDGYPPCPRPSFSAGPLALRPVEASLLISALCLSPGARAAGAPPSPERVVPA